jgi:chromosomal replication initiation ATPase DnaA
MPRNIRGEIIKQYNMFMVKVDPKDKPKRSTQDKFKILNHTDAVLFEGIEVRGDIIEVSRKDNLYKFFIKESKGVQVDVKNFVNILNTTIVDRINQEQLLFRKAFNPVQVSKIKSKDRTEIISLCRHMSIYYAAEYLSSQISYESLAPYYKRDRASMYHAVDVSIPNLIDTDNQIKQIITELNKTIKYIYNNLTS